MEKNANKFSDDILLDILYLVGKFVYFIINVGFQPVGEANQVVPDLSAAATLNHLLKQPEMIPGPIYNRTLEQLTEASFKPNQPCRAIKGEQKAPSSPSYAL